MNARHPYDEGFGNQCIRECNLHPDGVDYGDLSLHLCSHVCTVVTSILEMELHLVNLTGEDGFSLSRTSKPLIDILKERKYILLKNVTYINFTHLPLH
jgi:hypothetical protein